MDSWTSNAEAAMAEKSRKRPPSPKKPKTPSDRRHREELLDEALDETFPASDPVAMIEPAPGSEKGEDE
jgi:hypothetical protein